ncbi:ATP-binding cassette domain-containing protein [Eggerthellaceae bacterium zg-893]|nr:ATP-binding cassette domain-containing protein [Eggerthellaceae bacterium zg-893]
MEPVISVEGLTKSYGPARGVFDLSFSVHGGEALGFLGANGAGKTVTMRLLMGFVRAHAGTARIFGLDCFDERPTIQRRVGYLPGELALPSDMTARAFLHMQASLRGLHDLKTMHALIDYFELNPSVRIRELSKGNKQKVGIVNAFMHAPDVLLLDEPTSGLDLLMQRRFADLVQESRSKGAAVLLSSHALGEVERLCDQALFVRQGRQTRFCDPAALDADAIVENLYGPEAARLAWNDFKTRRAS